MFIKKDLIIIFTFILTNESKNNNANPNKFVLKNIFLQRPYKYTSWVFKILVYLILNFSSVL